MFSSLALALKTVDVVSHATCPGYCTLVQPVPKGKVTFVLHGVQGARY